MNSKSVILENNGWNNCIEYIIRHLNEFQYRYLDGGEYDYFPDNKLEKWLMTLRRNEC